MNTASTSAKSPKTHIGDSPSRPAIQRRSCRQYHKSSSHQVPYSQRCFEAGLGGGRSLLPPEGLRHKETNIASLFTDNLNFIGHPASALHTLTVITATRPSRSLSLLTTLLPRSFVCFSDSLSVFVTTLCLLFRRDRCESSWISLCVATHSNADELSMIVLLSLRAGCR